MSDNNDTIEAPTRRDTIKYGGAVITGGMLAGCASGDDDSESTPTATETATETNAGGDATATETPTESTATETASQTEDSSYSASIEPVGEVTFDSVPDRWITHSFSLDTAIAFGKTDGIVDTVGGASGFFLSFYDMLPGMGAPDLTGMDGLRGKERALKKELFYDFDPDMIGIDPNWLIAFSSGDASDIEEIIDNVAPFCGSYNRRFRGNSWPNWPDGEYRYYDLHELTDYWGQVFQEQERARAISDQNRSMVERVQSRVPDTDKTIGLIWAGSPYNGGEFYIYNPLSEIRETYGKKQYRDLGVTDMFAGEYEGQSSITVDAEAVLQKDPDVIILHFGLIFNQQEATNLFDTAEAEGKTVVEYTLERYRNDPVLSELSAVKNDEIYIGTQTSHGPIINMFNTEVLAKQLYPEEFGEWPGFNDDNTYDIPAEERLFDRQRVADIANGNI